MGSLVALVLKKFLKYIISFSVLNAFYSCTDDTPDPENKAKQAVSSNTEITIPLETRSNLDFPTVYVEELDQTQEFYKEQHETSFSYVPKKNWFSYTAQKNGILTKILLFGKPNFQPSDHYGDSMHGFVREGNPDKGPKYGEWELSRDDIVNQLSAQGLNSREAGWITIRMRGEIPQQLGQTYFLVCEKITGGKPWFGAFAFGEGNPYKPGKFWLHPEHDLVFRTYVGKTPKQVADEQKNLKIAKDLGIEPKSDVPTNPTDLPTPLPTSQTPPDQRIVRQAEPITVEHKPIQKQIIDVPQPIEPDVIEVEEKPDVQVEKLNFIQSPSGESTDKNETKGKKSLFNRLFKRE